MMNTRVVRTLGLLGVVSMVLILIILNPFKNDLANENDTNDFHGPEEKPALIISAEEQAINRRHQDRFLNLNTNLKSTKVKSTMADGQLSGTWNQFKFLTSDMFQGHLGFRVDGSLYDKENDIIYAVSYAGHLYRINRTDGDESKTDWELLNHKYNFLTHSYDYWNWTWKYYDGLNKADGSFRMIRAVQDGMEYSDNEGRDWIKVANLSAVESASEGAIAKTANGNKIYVLIKKSSALHQIYVSDDNGLTYSSLPTSFNPNSYFVKMFKAYNSESVFLAVYNKSSSKMTIYEHTADGGGFVLINTSNNTMLEPDSHRSFVSATFHNGTYHFYIGCNKQNLYYSTDKGASWTHTVMPQPYGMDVLREVHPTKPNVVFGGFEDLFHSKDYGKTWQGINWHIGWDVQHINFYQRKDGSYFIFVGNDMGCYINDNPEVKEDFIQLNNGSPIQMCYDADHGQHTYTSFSAMQDRGTTGYKTETKISQSHVVATTDALRTELSFNETSNWTWLYYGSINRRENFLFGDAAAVGVSGKGNWWASPMLVSPNPKEDAVYLAYGNKLTKLNYNHAYNKVIETQHHYDFNKISGSKISGFGYSPLNKNRWYVALENRDFYYSENGGQTFEKSAYTGARPWSERHWHKLQHIIKASKQDEKTVYWAGKGNTFLISKDGGKTFTNHINGLDVARIIDFDMTPDDKFIFAACWGAGAWVYSTDADRWYPILDEAIPASGVNFTDAEFIDKKNEIRFGTYGSGILSFTIDGQELEINYPDMLTSQLMGEKSVLLTWEDQSTNENGFIIERTTNGVFTEVARVEPDQTSYNDTDFSKAGNYIYRLKAFNASDESYYSNYAFATIVDNNQVTEVPKTRWTLVSVDNQSGSYPAEQAFDGDPNTIWHTEWGVSPLPDYPHTIVIDMHETLTIKGFGYLPRQDGWQNGIFKGFEFYISTDNENWTKVASGSWAENIEQKLEPFTSIDARYIKLVGLSEINGGALGSCAEISVYTQIADPLVPNTPIFIQSGRSSKTDIALTWLDLSTDEDGFIVEQMIDGEFTPIFTSDADVTTYQIADTDENSTYKFRIAAFNNIGTSEYSDVVTIYAKGIVVGINDKTTIPYRINVYPNPFTDVLNISAGNLDEFTNWQIIDLNGRLVKEGKLIGHKQIETVNVNELKAGTYILKLENNKNILSKSIIKN